MNINEYFTLAVSILTIFFFNKCKANDSSCFEIYTSVDKIELLTRTWLFVKHKHTPYDMIELPNFEDKISFERKFLHVGLQTSSNIYKFEKETTLKKIDVLLSNLHVICSEDLFSKRTRRTQY